MDPDANLIEQTTLACKLRKLIDSGAADTADLQDILIDVSRWCDLHDGLNQWLKRGGFLPEEWRRTIYVRACVPDAQCAWHVIQKEASPWFVGHADFAALTDEALTSVLQTAQANDPLNWGGIEIGDEIIDAIAAAGYIAFFSGPEGIFIPSED